jgi:hypothetical protein
LGEEYFGTYRKLKEIGLVTVTTEKTKQKVALREISRAKFERE